MCSAAMPSGARACSGPGVCVQRQRWSSSGVRQHSWGKVLPAMLRGYAFRGTRIQSKGRASLDQLQSSERMKMGDFNPHVVGGFSLLVIGFRSVSSRTGRAISFFSRMQEGEEPGGELCDYLSISHLLTGSRTPVSTVLCKHGPWGSGFPSGFMRKKQCPSPGFAVARLYRVMKGAGVGCAYPCRRKNHAYNTLASGEAGRHRRHL